MNEAFTISTDKEMVTACLIAHPNRTEMKQLLVIFVVVVKLGMMKGKLISILRRPRCPCIYVYRIIYDGV